MAASLNREPENPSTSSELTPPMTPPHSPLIARLLQEASSTQQRVVTVPEDVLCTVCGSNEVCAKCIDCIHLLCTLCVDEHARRLSSRLHVVQKVRKQLPIAPPRLTYAELPPFSETAANLLKACDKHKLSLGLFCDKCLVAACTECFASDHFGHKVSLMRQHIENAYTKYSDITSEISDASRIFHTALTQVAEMVSSIKKSHVRLSQEIESAVNVSIMEIETRRQVLQEQLDNIVTRKVRNLDRQFHSLMSIQDNLHMISHDLKDPFVNDSMEVVVSNNRAESKMATLRLLPRTLSPCEIDNINFIPPDIQNFSSTVHCAGGIEIGQEVMRRFNNFNMPLSRKLAQRVPFRCTFRFPGRHPTALSLHYPALEPAHIPVHERDSRPVYNVFEEIVVSCNDLEVAAFGVPGNKDGEFCRPWGVCCNDSGHMIVADRSNHRIQVFDANGRFLYKFGKEGSLPGQFNRPAGITVSPSGRIVVVDKDNHRVQVFEMSGLFLFTFGEKGSKNAQFNYPWDVACNSRGHMAVADTRNHRVQLFADNGSYLNKFGHETLSNPFKTFDSPRSVAFMPNGTLLITDFNLHKVLMVDRDFKKFRDFGKEGIGKCEFVRPQGIACDDHGNIIVADCRNSRVQILDSHGNFIGMFGTEGKFPGQFDKPSGVCLSPRGNIILVDYGNSRIQKFY